MYAACIKITCVYMITLHDNSYYITTILPHACTHTQLYIIILLLLLLLHTHENELLSRILHVQLVLSLTSRLLDIAQNNYKGGNSVSINLAATYE